MAATTDDFSQYPRVMAVDRRWRGHIVPAPNCPRCASTNTKFCYYNNYSLSQPRYFCKGCRRYWTKGGSLRDVPIGGGCRRRRQSRVAAKPFSGSTPYMANLGHRGSRDPAQDDSVNSDSRCKSSAPEIDLAAVFARFLNQNSSPETESNIEANALSEPSLDSVSVSESRDQSDLTNQDDQILGEIPQFIIDDQMLLQEEQTEAFNVQDFVPFEESPQDVFWHDPVATLQEFDSTILYADQIRNSTNLFSGDPWSCFDASGLEIFTRP